MNILKKIVHILSLICYVFIIFYAILCAPIIFKYKPLVVLTGSMEPKFKTGSIIYYKEVSEDKLKVGDIITFKLGDNLVSHRIYSIENGLYETKGDANNTVDANKIKYSDIVGKDADICIPYVGFYVKYINEHMFILIIVAAILVSEFLLSNIGNNERGKEKLNE